MKKWVIHIIIVSIVFIAMIFFIKPIVVNGNSMYSSIEHKDCILVNKQKYNFGEPKRGEVVVFPHQERDGSERLYIKRVIAIPEDRLEIKDNNVYINGELLKEDYLKVDSTTEGIVDYIIPEGEIFVMGDNRENSSDSRDFGTVTIDDVVGTAFFRLYPLKRMGAI